MPWRLPEAWLARAWWPQAPVKVTETQDDMILHAVDQVPDLKGGDQAPR